MPRGNFRTVALGRSVARPAMLLAGALAAGCSVVRPDVRAAEAHVVARGDGTAKVDIVLELRNGGDTEVELVTYDYLIRLADGSSYDGRWAALRALPPGQTVRATVPAILPVASATAGARWEVSGSVSYRDPQSFARILYEAGLLRTEAGFRGEGAIADAPASPAAAASAPAAAPESR